MIKSLLLISDQPDDATFAAQVAASANLSLDTQPSWIRAIESIALDHPAAIFFAVKEHSEVRAFESAIERKFGLFSGVIKPESIHFMSNKELFEVRELTRSPLFGNFFKRADPIEQANVAASYGRQLAAYLSGESSISHVLLPGADVQSTSLENTSQKQEAVEAVRQYLISAKIPSRISNLVGNAVDELLMNALFDAPCDEFGKPLYSSTSRNIARQLHGRDPVSFELGFDGERIAVQVRDQYGSIDARKLLNHVSASYKEDQYRVKPGQAGAGLGLANVHQSGLSMIYNCQLKQSTTATIICKVFPSYREFKGQFKFLSMRFHV